MSMSSLHFDKVQVVDEASTKTKWINIANRSSKPKFTATDRYSTVIMNNEGLYETNDASYDFKRNNFTIGFWVKFASPSSAKKYPFVNNRLIIMMNDGVTKKDIPITLDTLWHYYSFTRKGTNISICVDDNEIDSLETDQPFNLNDKSFIYIGNNVQGTIGDHFYIDGINILNRISMPIAKDGYVDTKPFKMIEKAVSTFAILSGRIDNASV